MLGALVGGGKSPGSDCFIPCLDKETRVHQLSAQMAALLRSAGHAVQYRVVEGGMSSQVSARQGEQDGKTESV
ncbi:hypothetical protein [Gibbsiella quercinecans]|uniref:hypothetical protein n=1 Tax=Gibbsiella quercinecans TaxID=929813 RepID=UPI003A4D5ECC